MANETHVLVNSRKLSDIVSALWRWFASYNAREVLSVKVDEIVRGNGMDAEVVGSALDAHRDYMRQLMDGDHDGASKRYNDTLGEYPVASTDEGGKLARAEEVPARENRCQGGSYVAQYPKDGEKFLVVIVYPDQIAPGPFTGADIAKDQGWC